jgi:phosphoadenosine phosphosulfate reductase
LSIGGVNLKEKIVEAVKILKEYEPPEGYYVAFSGGKDSLCIYYLTKIAGVKADYHYNMTTVDLPELVQFIKAFDDVKIEHLGVDKTMWNLIIKKNASNSINAILLQRIKGAWWR